MTTTPTAAQAAAPAAHPLERTLDGLRVIDFSQVAAGPLSTMILADLGADVIKIEPPTGDIGRTLGPPFIEGESTVFLSLNRNKRSVTLDLKCEEGRARARALIATADILVESFRPGVADRLGIGFQAARAINPRLIYCSISAYGQHGSWSHKPGVDGVVQAVSGLMSVIGHEGEPPSKVQAPIIDMVTGYHAALAILAAVNQRAAGSVPGHLDVNMFTSAVMLQQVTLSSYLTTGELPVRCGSGAPYATPNEAYQTADGYVLVAAYQPERWRRLCVALDRPDLADDPRFGTLSERMANRDALTAELTGAFRHRPTGEWVARLEGADIICAAVSDYDDVASLPLLAESGVLTTVHHPAAGHIVMPGFAIGGRSMAARRPPPRLGEHNSLLNEGPLPKLPALADTCRG
ncbi:CaiB/BaiF CoA transferase family protein [Methylobacterium nodulans]|uniref:L-carnitine dehydratase/bile acid-inducible protein F n=1 Tax=Methylobacterium nodulans (strain LMG 21967 / CNCM I-2342 / ORS 2060) TaxID=460265 RepID=B8INM5_METNO|nr:CoA transferase [Methylobacterium nodulans]ACL58391.1 L-carnitine dehydratase/bile acid-inducible protein F [Methylobacterium nodulans ORS 2060]